MKAMNCKVVYFIVVKNLEFTYSEFRARGPLDEAAGSGRRPPKIANFGIPG
jgi:hypothetical protein